MSFLTRIFPKPRVLKDRVEFDEFGVTRGPVNGKRESITWDELEEVAIVTTDLGQFVADVFRMLRGNNSGCVMTTESVGQSNSSLGFNTFRASTMTP